MLTTKYLLIPTRLRPTFLRRGIESWLDLAIRPDLVVPVVAVDHDDPTDYGFCTHAVRRERIGYRRLDVYYNEAASYARALGDPAVPSWMMISNDDQFATTRGWDEALDERADRAQVLFLQGDMGLGPGIGCPATAYPVVPSRLLDVWGHLGLNAHIDTWLSLVANDADALVGTPNTCQEFLTVGLVHQRMDDIVMKESVWDVDALHHQESAIVRRRDAVLLAMEHGYQGAASLAESRLRRGSRQST